LVVKLLTVEALVSAKSSLLTWQIACQKASMKGCVRLYVFDVSPP
jgi:hypothetical protein